MMLRIQVYDGGLLMDTSMEDYDREDCSIDEWVNRHICNTILDIQNFDQKLYRLRVEWDKDFIEQYKKPMAFFIARMQMIFKRIELISWKGDICYGEVFE